MNKLLLAISIILISSCTSPIGSDLIECQIEKLIYTQPGTPSIDTDSIKTLRGFKNFAEKALATLKDCSEIYGLTYNYENFTFNANIDTSKNIVIPCFIAPGKHCFSCMKNPGMAIYLTNKDTIKIVLFEGDSIKIPFKESELIEQCFNNYYSEKRKLSSDYDEFNYRWIYICLNDGFEFNSNLLPVFNILFTSYHKTIKQFTIDKYNKSICQFDRVEINDLLSSNRFRVFIKDYDVWEDEMIFKNSTH